MTKTITLKKYLYDCKIPINLKKLINEIAFSSKKIAYSIRRANIEGLHGLAGSENNQGEQQKKLDIISHNIIKENIIKSGLVKGLCSEEEENPIYIPPSLQGDYLLFFDPLDGSSNIEINITVGTIFSIIKSPDKINLEKDDFLSQNGEKQLAAGFILYGTSIKLVLTLGKGVVIFSLDENLGEFLLVNEDVKIPEKSNEFAINSSNFHLWEEPTKNFINYCLKLDTKTKKKRFNMRWIACVVADVYRILRRGGIFLYPIDIDNKHLGGRLRLMYEANPISFIIEQAGGLSIDGYNRILDIKPESLHQRVSLIFGSKQEVITAQKFYKGYV